MRTERILFVNALMSVMKLRNLKIGVDDGETRSHTDGSTEGCGDEAGGKDTFHTNKTLSIFLLFMYI